MDDFRLSEHFGFCEMTDSDDHPELVEENRESCRPEHVDNLRLLCESLLEDIRDEYQRPVLVLSGFRCRALNTAVHGSPNSQHMRGQAADIRVRGMPAREVFLWIRDRSGLIWHELILYAQAGFVHVSLPTGQADMQHWVEA